jgi:arylsulfatase A-like enzyme
MKATVGQCSLYLSLCLALACTMPLHAAGRPNIVYVIADDLGNKDAGFQGGTFSTPNLDKLAASGAHLKSFYVQPFSSQTRAALLTGRYPMRYGLQTMSIVPSSRFGLPTEERTLAQGLKNAGYKTVFIGKWQLGHARPEFWPTRRGFDHFYGTLSGEVQDRVSKTSRGGDWRRNDQIVKEDGAVTQLLAKEAVYQISKHDAATPLFLVVAFNSPAADASAETGRGYAAGVTALDDAIGQLIAALQQQGMLRNTLLVFHSDNGGAIPTKFDTGDNDVKQAGADNGIYRGGKGSLYEGGVRVPAIVVWPDAIKEKTVVTNLLHVTDMYPTLLGVAGVKIDQPKKLDGFDAWATLAQARLSPREEILLNVEAFRGAIRAGEWKLIVRATLPGKMELFDIANDPEESQNQAEAYPDRVKSLLKRLNDFSYEMATSLYLEELGQARTVPLPIYWGDNPMRR